MKTFSASLVLSGLTGAVALCLTLGFREPPLPQAPQVSQVHGESFVARDLDFVLRNGATPEKHQIETMAGGVAVLDFDNDGHPDVFFANGATQPGLEKSSPAYWNRLYRNRGDGTFEDVTAKSGLQGAGFSIGAAVGRSEEHTSELQSQSNLVCRLLLEKKKKKIKKRNIIIKSTVTHNESKVDICRYEHI